MPKHVNHEEKSVFIHVPKTGGTSMERALSISATIHLKAASQRNNHPGYFLWGFVRHPCDRILSAYYYECRNGRLPVTFAGMYDYVVNPPKKLHTTPQVEFTHRGEELMLDFVGRFESINEDFRRVCGLLGFDELILPVLNRTRHPPWTELFTESMVHHTRRIFAADFEQFEYDPFAPPAAKAGQSKSNTVQSSAKSKESRIHGCFRFADFWNLHCAHLTTFGIFGCTPRVLAGCEPPGLVIRLNLTLCTVWESSVVRGQCLQFGDRTGGRWELGFVPRRASCQLAVFIQAGSLSHVFLECSLEVGWTA